MTFFGVDFTSAPQKRKPIVIAECRVDSTFEFVQFLEFVSLSEFDEWLHSFEGVAGIDAPFGFPVEFRNALGLQGDWEAQAKQIEEIGFDSIFKIANDFRALRPVGDKEPKRLADEVTQSVSSMKMYNPPIGRMAVRIIPQLAKTDACIFPVRMNDSSRVIFEIYCTPFARKVVGRTPYKNKPGLREVRIQIANQLPIRLNESATLKIEKDDLGDYLDAVIGAYEAFVAFEKLKSGTLLLPKDLDPLEGWTVSSIS